MIQASSATRLMTLGDVVTFTGGFSFKSSDWKPGGVPVIKIANVRDGDVTLDGCSFVDAKIAALSSAYAIQKGDLLMTLTGEIGAMGFYKLDTEARLNQRLCKVSTKNTEELSLEYVHYFLTSPTARQTMWQMSKGAAQANISIKDIATLVIPLPPLEAQRAIVEALDDHLSLLDKALAEVRLAQYNSRLLVMASLEKVIDGRLPRVRLGDITVSSGYGTSTKCVAGGPGVPVARIPNLINGTIDMTDEKRAQSAGVDLTNLMLTEGDLLVIRTNGSQNLVGKTAVVPENISASFASYLIRFKVDKTRVHPKWVHAMFGSLEVRQQVVELSASSAGQYNLGLSKLNSIAIPLPDIDAQTKLLQELDKINSHLDSLNREQVELASHIKTLRRTILNKAFTGGIVNA